MTTNTMSQEWLHEIHEEVNRLLTEYPLSRQRFVDMADRWATWYVDDFRRWKRWGEDRHAVWQVCYLKAEAEKNGSLAFGPPAPNALMCWDENPPPPNPLAYLQPVPAVWIPKRFAPEREPTNEMPLPLTARELTLPEQYAVLVCVYNDHCEGRTPIEVYGPDEVRDIGLNEAFFLTIDIDSLRPKHLSVLREAVKIVELDLKKCCPATNRPSVGISAVAVVDTADEVESHGRPVAFGDRWRPFLNDEVGQCWTRIHTVWLRLDSEAGRRGWTRPTTISSKSTAALREIEPLIAHAVEWCRFQQETGDPVESMFTPSHEKDLIEALNQVIDGILKQLGDQVRTQCEIQKQTLRQRHIERGFQDGRRMFRRPTDAEPPIGSLVQDVGTESQSVDDKGQDSPKATTDRSEFLRLSSNVYQVAGFGQNGVISATKGMHQIAMLLDEPNTPVPMERLDGTEKDLRIKADKRSEQLVAEKAEIKKLWAERNRLKAEFEQAQGNADLEKGSTSDGDTVIAAECQERIDEIDKALSVMTGINRKPRDLNNLTNKRRTKIWGTLSTAFKRMKSVDLDLVADHLESFIRSEGSFFVYDIKGIPVPDWQREICQIESD